VERLIFGFDGALWTTDATLVADVIVSEVEGDMRIETSDETQCVGNIYAYGFILTYHVLFTARKPRKPRKLVIECQSKQEAGLFVSSCEFPHL
jgi:hypothetical protein